MHIFVTGVQGQLGRSVQSLLLSRGHTITGCDIVEQAEQASLPEGSIFVKADVCDYKAVEAAIKEKPCDAVIHLAAIRTPVGYDQREVHNVNVVSSYNVLKTAADLGIKRIVQASSVNATGLVFTKDEHQHFDELPLHEKSPMRPEDGYSLSKLICEAQADSLARLYPDIRIASLRFSALRDDRSSAKSIGHRDLFAYSMTEAVARACLAGISSDKFNGHEVFYAIAPDIAYEHLPEDDATWDKFGLQGDKRTSLELLAKTYPGTTVRKGWWVTGQERRGFFDCSKAEQLLDWKHDA